MKQENLEAVMTEGHDLTELNSKAFNWFLGYIEDNIQLHEAQSRSSPCYRVASPILLGP